MNYNNVISNVIFDIGNVLLSFKPLEYLKAKIADQDKALEVYEQIFHSDEWVALDRGTLSEEEAINILSARYPENERYIKMAFDNWYDLLTPIEDTVKLLRDIKAAKYKTYFLSNFQELAYEVVSNRYNFFNLFDGGIVSYKEKLIKPEESIYKRLLEKYGIKPEESVFTDDTQVNVEAAVRLGFNGVVFKDADDLREKLISYGIQI